MMKAAQGVLIFSTIFLFVRQAPAAQANRQNYLIWDYGQALLRTLPQNSAFYLDGGDDAFYSLALLHESLGKRPDVDIHDRGGLVFHNPYGDDFRSLSKPLKDERRRRVEGDVGAVRPLFYSTMDWNVLPGASIRQVGFLLEAFPKPGNRIDWPLIALRSLNPLTVDDYRTRAVACFFPYMMGIEEKNRGNIPAMLTYFRRAQTMGADVDWLTYNLGYEYSRVAYSEFVANRLENAKLIYQQWLAFDPDAQQAHINLGVVYEKLGDTPSAEAEYRTSSELFPGVPDPVFNLAVLAWKRGDWDAVINDLEEVLRRSPGHERARGYLEAARKKKAAAKHQ